jgi:hypothetical protein
MPSLLHKRGTRAQIDAAATANQLKPGEIYLITDENRLTVGTAINSHAATARQGEGAGANIGVHVAFPVPPGGYAHLSINATGNNNVAHVADRLDLIPFFPMRSITIDQLRLEVAVAGAAGTTARLGVYASNAAGNPGTLLREGATTIDTAGAGTRTTVISPSLTMNAGTIYWIAVLSSGAPSYRGVPQNGAMVLDGDGSAAGIYSLRRATFAYAPLPATAPATTRTGSIIPLIGLRVV